MPSPGTSQAARAIQERYEKVQDLFLEHFPLIQSLRTRALSETVPSLRASLKLTDEDVTKLQDYLNDIPSLFRHAKRAKFHAENTLHALRETMQWRITSEVDNLDFDELHPLYVDPPSVARALQDVGGPSATPTTTEAIAERPPLFWINDRLKDHFGRPCGVISLRTLERTEERNLENLKEYILASVEIVRRHIADLYARSEVMPESPSSTPANSPRVDQGEGANDDDDDDDIARRPRSGPLQMVLACDLEGAGMSNLEIELLPFLLDLLKKHYPGHIAVMYLLHYGWVHAGMWTLAKRVLPQPVLDKIVFPKDDGTPLEEGGKRGDIEDYFDRRRWPRALGKCGAWVVPLDEAHNSVMRRFSSSLSQHKRPASRSRSRSLSRHSSRSSSFVNLHQLGAFTPMDEKGNALGPWALAAPPDAPPGPSGLGIGLSHASGLGELKGGGAHGAFASTDWGASSWDGTAQPPARRRWRDLFRTLTYLLILRILTLNRRMRRRVVDLGRVVGRSLVAGGGQAAAREGEEEEEGGGAERMSRHANFVHGGGGAGVAGGQKRTSQMRPSQLPSLQMSSSRQQQASPDSPLSPPGVRSPTQGPSNVRYPTGWGPLGSARDGSLSRGRAGAPAVSSRYRGSPLLPSSSTFPSSSFSTSHLSARALWRSSMRWMRSLTLFALIVALFQTDFRTGMPKVKRPGVATLWDSVRAAAILGAGTVALRS